MNLTRGLKGLLWVAGNRARRLLDIPSTPKFVSVATTWRCNSRCSTCGIWRAPLPRDELTVEEYEAVLRDPALRDITVWEMTGGEPMLYDSIFELTGKAFEVLPERTGVRIGTNGLLDKKIMELAGEFRDEPLYFSLSIDGVGETHDEIRGVPGNFEKIENLIHFFRSLQDSGSPIAFGASVCVSKLNIDHIPTLTAWLTERRIPFQLTPVIFPDYGKTEHARRQRAELDFETPAERARAVDLFSRYDRLTYEVFCRYWSGLSYPVAPCYALREYVHLRPNGDVEVCMWRPLVVGNLREQTLSEIWNGERAEKLRGLIRDCQACANIHPNLCDALNNLHFHGTTKLISYRRRLQ